MFTKFDYLIKATNKRSTLLTGLTGIFILLGFVSFKANAVVIDFDDVAVYERPGQPYDYPLTNEYESLGLIVNGGYLVGETFPDGTHENYLVGNNHLQLIFVGSLPTFVSMSVSAGNFEAVFLNASGPDGYQGYHQTNGYAGSEEDPPYEPNQYVSFASSTGISHIDVTAFYNRRWSGLIDDLTLEYASVPEPSSLILLILGCFGLIWRQRNARIKGCKLNA